MSAKKNDQSTAEQGQEKPEAFDAKWLKGLTFTDTRMEKVKDEDGKVTEKPVVFQRPLEEDDLLDWKIYGSEVVLATADGRKYRVRK